MMLPFTNRFTTCIRMITLSAVLLIAPPLYAQYNAPQNKIWIFGLNAGLDFNSGNPLPVSSAMNTGNSTGTLEANASVCDANGALLFYTDGSIVRDRLGNVMPNGNDLTGQGIGSTNSTSQGALIIPVPDSAGKYYVFSLTSVDQATAVRGKLYYSIVDMSLNSGMGDVVPGRKGIFVDDGLTEKMIGIRGSQCNIWVLTCVRGQAKYKAYEITAGGLNTTPVVSNAATSKNLSFGYLAVSPDHKHIACSEESLFAGNNGLELAKFDDATGTVFDAVQLEPSLGYYGISFSPDNTKLYGNSFADIFQFDITAPDPFATKTMISTNGRSTGMELGPDAKIYFEHSASVNNKVSVIKFPDLSGMACAPLLDNITLLQNTTMNFGLHNTVPVFKRDTLFTNQADTAGCFAYQYSIAAADTTGWGYEWNNGNSDVRINTINAGTYWVKYHTAPCVFHTDTFTVSFPNGVLPQVDIKSSCSNTHNGKAWAYTFSTDTVQYHYTWTNENNDTLSVTDSLLDVPSGSYHLHIATFQCDTMLSVVIPEETYHVSFTADSLVCLGETIQYQNNSPLHFTQYQWYFGDDDSTTIVNPAHQFPEAGVYMTTLIGKGLICTDTVSKAITVDAPVTNISFHKEPDNICKGQQIKFNVSTDSTLTDLYWQWGDGNSLTNNEEEETHAYDKVGTLPFGLTAHFRACPDLQVNDTIMVAPFPLVDLGTDTLLCLDGHPIELSNKQSSQPGDKYSWNTGSEGASIIVHHEGIYSLTMTNVFGCSTTESVTINKDCYIDIPNAFTPDGDGINDYFFPRQLLSSGLSGMQMKIINRWGMVVFESSSMNGRGWDGAFNGKPQPQGVYIYIIEVILKNGRSEKYQGNVTLMR